MAIDPTLDELRLLLLFVENNQILLRKFNFKQISGSRYLALHLPENLLNVSVVVFMRNAVNNGRVQCVVLASYSREGRGGEGGGRGEAKWGGGQMRVGEGGQGTKRGSSSFSNIFTCLTFWLISIDQNKQIRCNYKWKISLFWEGISLNAIHMQSDDCTESEKKIIC